MQVCLHKIGSRQLGKLTICSHWTINPLRTLHQRSVLNTVASLLINVHALTFLIYLYRDDWPVSANWNAMDVWQILCYHNVFFVLVEYCVVLSLSKGITLESIMTTEASKLPSKGTEIVSISVVKTFVKNKPLRCPSHVCSG